MKKSAAPDFETAFCGPIRFDGPEGATPVATHQDRNLRQDEIRQILARDLYGSFPSPPDAIHVSRTPIAGEVAERLKIDITVGDQRFCVDAALWLPPNPQGKVPLICGLDFVGPAGVLSSNLFPLDANARIYFRADMDAGEGVMSAALRGTATQRWPIDMLLAAGYGVMISCYGSWVPDDPQHWTQTGVYPLFEDAETGAISLWAWSISRLLDAAQMCDEIDTDALFVAGHSRLGKAALWAASNDARIASVFANQSGCAGAAPAAHGVGETLSQMAAQFPHWARPGPNQGHLDQHDLLASIAPRGVYLAGAKSDLWSDPLGSFAALQSSAHFWSLDGTTDHDWPSAREVWETQPAVQNGSLGFHLRAGSHDILPQDWQHFLNFLTQNDPNPDRSLS